MDKNTVKKIIDLASEILTIDPPIPVMDGIDSSSFKLGFYDAKIQASALLMKAIEKEQEQDD